MSEPCTVKNAVPSTWKWCSIADVAQTSTGGTPSRAEPSYFGGDVPWVKSGELGDSVVYRTDETITSRGLAESNAKLFPAGTLCIALYGATVGKLGILGIDAATNQAVCAIFLSPSVETRYVYRYLEMIRRSLVEQGKGGAQPNISNGIVRSTQFPLAPLNEQRRIVAKIEELFSDLDAGVAALERARANLKRYRASVLAAAVSGRLTADWRAQHPDAEPASELLKRILAERRRRWEADQRAKFAAKGKQPPKGWQAKYVEPAPPDTADLPELPEGWCWASVEQIGEVQGGIQKQPKRAPASNAYPFLRVANVYRNRLELSDVHSIELFGNELERLRLQQGDMLIVEGNGSKSEIGRSAIWRGGIDNCVHQNHIIRVRLPDGDSSFLNVYWNSPFGNGRVMENAASTSGLYTLSVAKVSSLAVPVPPLVEQKRIVDEVAEKLSQIDAAETAIDHGLRRAARLRQSILKQAFAGRLVPQDPNDEPASVLLERLRAERSAEPAQKAPKIRKPRAERQHSRK